MRASVLLLTPAVLLASACQEPSRPPPQAPAAPQPTVPAAAPTPYVPDPRFAKEAPAQPDAAGAPTPNDAAHLFQKNGCSACHGVGAPFHDKLAAARGKPVEQVAQWIRTPRAFKPTTLMPTYANQINEAQARALATWVKAGNPGDDK
ncbi:MAG: cytochrome c [Myxococcaceae bacterium]|nr:cytochrome c [Myxococcaceae bacterium]MCI0670234.1 cytochrome c [Myxococcaceae bacterium]